MRHRITIAVCCALWGGAADAVPCDPDEGREVLRLTGDISTGERFTAPAGPGWTFVLEPGDHGWTIRLLDQGGDDLSRITPPFHFVPNPRELHGWHFRNRANTGPNLGDVNAPQRRREFIFDRGGDADRPLAERVAAAEGRGTLVITDFSLSPPEPGERAKFAVLSFDACLSWPAGWGAGKE
jgi:hypothetical protein